MVLPSIRLSSSALGRSRYPAVSSPWRITRAIPFSALPITAAGIPRALRLRTIWPPLSQAKITQFSLKRRYGKGRAEPGQAPEQQENTRRHVQPGHRHCGFTRHSRYAKTEVLIVRRRIRPYVITQSVTKLLGCLDGPSHGT